MEFIKKFQYSLILFVVSIFILSTGFLPSTERLLHRYVVDPEGYVPVRGVIISMEKLQNLQKKPDYDVTVSFLLEDGETETTAVLLDYVEGMKEEMEISFFYARENPEYAFQIWSLWSDFLLHGSFTILSFATGVLMTQPPSPPYEHRKPKTLRERLEKY